MKIRQQDKTMFIADDSDNAKKIALGFDFDIDNNNQITVYATSAKMGNKFQLRSAIQKANSVPDLKVILLKLVQLIDNVV